MEYEILLPLAMILLLSKLLSMGCKKIGLPAVIGMLVAGILIGLLKLIPNQKILTPFTMEGLSFLAKIGVILIMFSAGIETDLKQFKSTGIPSIVITSLGVIFPLGFGFIVACLFNGGFSNLDSHTLLCNLFYGTILAATSVSITVAALKELGKLNTKVGTSIVSAAILDDIIGVILLSLFISLESSGSAGEIGKTIGMMIAFFAAAIAVGFVLDAGLKWVSKKYPHTRRIPIFCFAMCFFYAWAAEHWFGVADITGAYVAGLILSNIGEKHYVDQKIETSNYMIFAPVFFANIGIQTSFSGIDGRMVGFGFAFILAGILGKVIGCSLGALICKYSLKDSMRVGVGMMVRAEVVLVCAQKGVSAGMVSSDIMPFIIILIILTSLITPIILKASYRKDDVLPPTPLNPVLDGAGGVSDAGYNTPENN